MESMDVVVNRLATIYDHAGIVSKIGTMCTQPNSFTLEDWKKVEEKARVIGNFSPRERQKIVCAAAKWAAHGERLKMEAELARTVEWEYGAARAGRSLESLFRWQALEMNAKAAADHAAKLADIAHSCSADVC